MPVGEAAEQVQLGDAHLEVVTQAGLAGSKQLANPGEVALGQRRADRIHPGVLANDVTGAAKHRVGNVGRELRQRIEREIP